MVTDNLPERVSFRTEDSEVEYIRADLHRSEVNALHAELDRLVGMMGGPIKALSSHIYLQTSTGNKLDFLARHYFGYTVQRSLGQSDASVRKQLLAECDRLTSLVGHDNRCSWYIEDGSDTWWTGCGESAVFYSDGPVENGFKFCPYCGGEIRMGEGE